MNKFFEIARATFKIQPGVEIIDSMSAKDIPEWDSMNYLFFIAELEKEFKVSFTMDEVMNVKCLGDLRKMVEQRNKTL